MKRKITILLAAAASIFQVNAQIALNESFTATFVPATAGWSQQNNSVPIGTGAWFQGNPTAFAANSGGPSDYFGCNYQSQAATAGGISNFLITPTLNLVNGATFKFFVRTVSPIGNADRLQILMSQGTGTGAIGAGTVAVGTFTTNLLDINPNLTLLNNSAVSNGSVNGFPDVWTAYTLTLSAITGTVPGRFAFRYFVNDGGLNGVNSDYIGIDDVVYTLPCAQPTLSINPPSVSICSSNSATFVGSGATSYTWNTGPTTASLSVSPTVTTVYTLSGSNVPGCIGTQTIAVTVTLTPNVAVSNLTTCPATAATLVASGASTYSWNTTAITSSIIVTPAVNTTYTVTGKNGICANTKTVSVTIGANLSILVSSSSASVCAGSSATLTAGGANTYTWSTANNATSIVVTPTTNTTYTVAGTAGVCNGLSTIIVGVNPSPTVSIAMSNSIVCVNAGTISITASGALTYSWAPFASNATVVTVNTPTTAGTYSLGLTGTSAAGCVGGTTSTLVVALCTGVENNSAENNSASVFPNPFTNELTITGVNGAIEIYNTLGQIVFTATISELETINTASLTKGIYFVKVKATNDTKEKTIKIIKN